MHSYIFQIGTKPIEIANKIKAWDYLLGIGEVAQVADYVRNVKDSEATEACGQLLKALTQRRAAEHIRITTQIRPAEPTTTIFEVDAQFAKAYFSDRLEQFQSAIKKLADNATLEGLASHDCSVLIYDIREIHTHTEEFYIHDEGTGRFVPLDDFVRTLLPGQTYYIGGVLDYHC